MKPLPRDLLEGIAAADAADPVLVQPSALPTSNGLPDTAANITVLRALGGLGDVLVAVPALCSLRRRYPLARITYIGLPQVAPVIGRFDALVDRFLPFPGFPGIPELPFDANRLHAFLEARRSEEPADLVVQMHGSGSVSNVFAALLRGRHMLGYHLPDLWKPEGQCYLPFPAHLSEEARWSRLVGDGGCAAGPAACLPISDEERGRAAALTGLPAASRYAVIHCGASEPARRWPAERFATVADELADHGLTPVLTGTAAEAGLVAQVAGAMRAEAINLAGRTGLGEVAALVERASLVLSNDTGIAHIAANLSVPSVIVFIASDPARWAPADRLRHRVVGQGIPDRESGKLWDAIGPVHPPVNDVLAACLAQLEAVSA